MAELATTALLESACQIAWVLGPLGLVAFILHHIERLTTAVWTRSFGWNAALWTGWLGAPIHELSHAALCPFFAHDVVELRPFSPDPERGRLGFVRHDHDPRNPWAHIGKLFIGIAPLAGGALAIWLSARLLVPEIHVAWVTDLNGSALGQGGDVIGRIGDAFSHSRRTIDALLRPETLLSLRGGVFLYVATCIGIHLTPSRDDLRGAAWGAAALAVTLYAVNLGVEIGGGSADATALALAGALTPLLGVLVLSATLGGVVLILSVCITSVYEAVRGAGLTHPLRLARWQWKRLSLLLFALAASYALTSN